MTINLTRTKEMVVKGKAERPLPTVSFDIKQEELVNLSVFIFIVILQIGTSKFISFVSIVLYLLLIIIVIVNDIVIVIIIIIIIIIIIMITIILIKLPFTLVFFASSMKKYTDKATFNQQSLFSVLMVLTTKLHCTINNNFSSN